MRASECGAHGFATLPAMLDLLQEAASIHAKELGFSKSDFAAHGENTSWVLTSMKTRMTRYPRWEEEVKIATWPHAGRKITALRDFEMYGADGAKIGAATSEWMVIDLASRHIAPIPGIVAGLANDERPGVFVDEPFARLKWPGGDGDASAEFKAMRCHIDLNGHVNNVHYAEWFLETVPENAGECIECEIVFKSETLAGETVVAKSCTTGGGEYIHLVSGADGREHVVARTVWKRRGKMI